MIACSPQDWMLVLFFCFKAVLETSGVYPKLKIYKYRVEKNFLKKVCFPVFALM